jgi:hypothetical protein
MPLEESGQLKFADTNKVQEPVSGIRSLPLAGGANGTITGLNEVINFTDTISMRVVHGHTESMMLPQINYRGKTIVYMADLLPSVNHLPLPYVMAYDIQPLKTLDEKQQFLGEAVANDYVLFVEHDRKTECCTVQQTEKGIRAKDLFRLEEL